MTYPADITLDHVGAIGRDLDAAARRWERMGYTLSPLSRQRGAVPGRDGMHPWATANRCAVFDQGYVELIGIVDPAAFNPWQRFLGRFEGLHLLAFRCAEATSTYEALKIQAPFLSPPVERERKLTYRGEERTMRFRNIFSRDEVCPEGRYIVIEHQTPELLWQPELTVHENGARALVAATMVADDRGVEQRLDALGGIVGVEAPAAFADRYGWRPPAPSLAAITIAFDDLDRTLRLLRERRIEVRREGEEVWVPPAETNGFVMRLVQHG